MIPAAHPDGPELPGRRRFDVRRIVHVAALGLVALLAWLILRAYRDPGLMLELANWRLC